MTSNILTALANSAKKRCNSFKLNSVGKCVLAKSISFNAANERVELFYLNTGKNPTYTQAKIKLSALQNTVYCVNSAFCCFTSEMKNKEITMVDFNNKVLNI